MIACIVFVEEVPFLLAGNAHLPVGAEAEHHAGRTGILFSEEPAGNTEAIGEDMVAAKSALGLSSSVAVLAARAIEKELFAESAGGWVGGIGAGLAGGVGEVELVAGLAEQLVVDARAGHALVFKKACGVVLGALQAFASLELEGRLAKLAGHLVRGLSAVRADATFEEVVWALKVAKVRGSEFAGRALSVGEEESATLFTLAWVGEILAGQALLLAEVVSLAELAGVLSDCLLTGQASAIEEDRVLAALAGGLVSSIAVLRNRKHDECGNEEKSLDLH